MPVNRRFPLWRVLKNCIALLVLNVAASPLVFAQDSASPGVTRPRRATVVTPSAGVPTLETDIQIISEAASSDYDETTFDAGTAKAEKLTPLAKINRFDPLKNTPRVLDVNLEQALLHAIEVRLGLPYVFGAQGPRAYDCSGFVWSVFRTAGAEFERTNARTFWHEFSPARFNEQRRFGTLVFFNNLKHVGIVADERGFFHASTSQGVTYSLFDDYWSPRIDGYRTVPVYDLMARHADEQ